ncbi:PEP/pyruvate-binding domain-containing protein [Thermophagus sp. OGC60D27]|uniref:PEP/pyruvate-binding domain-containing protein n=1 Tax=Thermophagus sp. OGC60D27 TaxID=3458415 RepID=UPI0040379689
MNQGSDYVELSKIYKRKKTDQDIFQELMSFKVTEVLLVATYYDSYSIVREGRFFDKIFGEYLQLNLFSAPRITSVATYEEAMLLIEERKFDMVILMAGLDKQMPITLSQEIHRSCPSLPVLLMVNNNEDLKYFDESSALGGSIDKVFVWNGDSRVFLAMIKYVEDKLNTANDVKVGDVRIILLVEDSQRYYSRYLPMLYSIIMIQTQNILAEETSDQTHKILKMRVRPKVLLVSTYEEAVEIVDQYLDNLICVISDVKYMRDGQPDENAGVDLISYVKSKINIPTLLQSSDPENAQKAEMVGADFIDKNSDTLSMDLYNFIHQKLGFGNFVFTNSRGITLATAKNLKEFISCLKEIPAESLLYHARRNGISTWLMARGEISIAKRLRPYRIEDFESTTKLRQKILDIFEEARLERLRGRVVQFDPALVKNDRFVMRIGDGSFGGKGRGLAFLSNFIENIDFLSIVPDLNIKIPPTTIIGAGEFSVFLEKNHLLETIYEETDFEDLQHRFLSATLSDEVECKLRQYIECMEAPLAVRSSGLFEDSLLQPFAGVFSTYVLPNNDPNPEVRFSQLASAVKLVYASIFSPTARAYFEAVHYKIDEEKMAVIIQQLVGQKAHNRYYPHVSGVAQSFNYYPFSYMKPEDGFAVIGVGLGKYVVGGERAWRFCPRYPGLELSSLGDQIKDSQQYFYAVDMEKENVDFLKDGEDAFLSKLDISEAEEDGNLKHCASVYDINNDRLVNDFSIRGPRVLNFADILKYDMVPLPRTLDTLLRYFREAMGAPVEIEFALDLDPGDRGKPTLWLLQIKPLIRLEKHMEVDFSEVEQKRVIIKSEKGMGNGRYDHIKDVVFMNVEKFDRTKTGEMAKEVAMMNKKMEKEGLEYVLIGPGRWGTRDPSTGIPVFWSQISQARVIVEMGLPDFPLDASLGSHFFHNVTSLNIGYFSVLAKNKNEFVDLDFLKKQQVIEDTRYFKHIRLEQPLTILMDGKQQKAVVMWNEEN